ncbi:hypothetical protein GGR58DRAFT_510462 [Xylaria digitata]|nr:hypothetical protein GGR58DRAFT_510462 [Xylaria digitata]
MVHNTPNTMRNIRYSVLCSLPSYDKFSLENPSPTPTVKFQADWDPLGYISTQYEKAPRDFLGTALTLTGSFTDAQSTTCKEYMKQTWPSSGEHTLLLLKEVLSKPGCRSCCKLPDDTSVSAIIVESKLDVIVCGVEDSIAEIGEQIAWIAAALRLAPGDLGVFGCIPYIRHIFEYTKSPVPESVTSYDAIFGIQFYFLESRAWRSSTGQCWHNLFKNPTLVQGYPTPFKPGDSRGLEIAIDVVAGLIEAPCISTFGDKIFLKGFCSMLTPTNQYAGTIVWHLIHNGEGKHISYLDAHEYNTPQRVVVEDVMASRHIVGWCQEASFYTGTSQATYPVQKPFLPPTTADCLLHGIKVQGRTIITQYVFERARRDKPHYIPEEAMLHLEKLNLMKDKHVVLWDVGDERGWLVNGVSAWSHLLRAHLKHQFEDDDNYEPGLVEPPNPYKARAPFDFFKNPENMKLILIEDEHKGSTRLRTVQDVSDRIFNMLDLLLEHQTGAIKQCTRISRKFLSGWAFRDLAKERELEPCAIELPDVGKNWIDFTRALSAVTLFGQDFGEMILPRSSCEHWAKLPTGQFYLATSGLVLNRIIADIGSSPERLWRLGRDIVWHNPTGLCKCSEGRGDHSDVTQVLLPEKVSRDEPQIINPRKVDDDSAVIFGYNSEHSWIWQDFGHPTRGYPSPPIEVHEESLPIHGNRLGLGSDKSSNTPVNSDAYTVGIVCALPKEGAAMEELFDKVYERIEKYVLGCIGEHHVVLAYLSGQYGITAAATAAKELGNYFHRINFGLLVGIAGGCPSEENDIRLGDVVVSSPKDTHPGVIQYDLGKRLTNGEILRTGALKLPPNHLLGTVASVIEDFQDYRRFEELIESVSSRNAKYRHPGQKEDVWKSAPCKQCQNGCINVNSHVSKRKPRDSDSPTIHRGLIGSGNMVIKDSIERDRLSSEYGILCVDMEAAGVMHNTVEVPFIVVRGISDYADSHKNDQWHNYAALAAAAFARVLLERVGETRKFRNNGYCGLKRDFVVDDTLERSAKRTKK